MTVQPLISERARFADEITAWTDDLLAPYLLQLDAERTARVLVERETGDGPARKSKEFNDAVWGTIVLRPLEVLFLDSPLLQRLRQIRQLGVVHLVYPSAEHTRFEHSIGTVAQISRVIDSINTQAPAAPVVSESLTHLLRLAALCHDVGHGAMSHVSENALKNFDDVETIRLEFTDVTETGEKARLSEIAAYYILAAPSVVRLLELSIDLSQDHTLPLNALNMIQKAIVGLPVQNDMPLLQELVSGPFDADKLDYMTRDAQMTGVPVITDIPRLVRKVRALTLREEELPEEVARFVTTGETSYTLTGIALSGATTLDELMIGRSLLRDKLFRHQKVRAAEMMIASIYQQLAPQVARGPALLGYLLTDSDLLNLDDDVVRRLGIDPAGASVPLAVARDLASRLRDRRLFVRAYAFAQNMPLDPYKSEVEHWRGLEVFGRHAAAPDQRGSLIGLVAHELVDVLDRLGKSELLDVIPGRDPEPYLWLDPPQAPEQGSDIPRAYLITDDRRVMRFKDDYAETLGWSVAYPLTRDMGFLFTLSELAPYAFIAMEKLLRDRYRVKTPESMLPYARREPRLLAGLKRELATTDYYHQSAFDLRPLPERLTRADVTTRLRKLTDRLQGYEGPVREGHLGKQASLMNAQRALDWLAQFGTDELTDSGLRVLEHITMIGRRQITRALRDFLTEHPEYHDGSLCPLGEPKDSSAILTYYAEDVAGDFRLTTRSVIEALNHDGPLVLVDDFIGTGNQSSSIFEALLGEAPSSDLGEERPAALQEALRDELRRRRIAIVFAGGMAAGRDRLRERLNELGLDAEVHVAVTDLPTVFDPGLFDTETQRDRFVARCRELGANVLLDDENGHDAAWVADKQLGYGDFGFLVIFPYNTPTQTLSVLWAAGEADGVPWAPLFPRRPKR